MIKGFIFLFALILSILTHAQADCTYAQVELSNKKHISLIRTYAQMVDNFTTESKGRVIDFSLVNSKGIVVLNIEVYKDGKEVLTPACIGKDARLSFRLTNGEEVVLPQIGARLCGFQLESQQPGFYNIKNRGSFLITEDKYKTLKENPLVSMNLSSENFTFYSVITDELYDDVNDTIVNPTNYFIDYLNCVVNPTIVVQD